MKSRILITILSFFLSWNFVSGQGGSDVLFILDNSGSIDSLEFAQMKQSCDSLMTRILNCNRNNRVALVQYASSGPPNGSILNIDYDFTNNISIATNYTRAYLGGNDYLYETMSIIGNALDGISNTSITSTQTTLNQNLTNGLVIFIFTDASRSNFGSSLLNSVAPNGIGTNNAFQIFTNFKNNRGAQFVVTHKPPNLTAQAAGAAIASSGGNYVGPIESYTSDPDGPGIGPRMFFMKNDFILSPAELTALGNTICGLSSNIISFAFEPLCVQNYHFNVPGTINLPNGASIDSFIIQLIDISTGNDYMINSTATFPTPNTFNFSFNYFDIDIPKPITGQYQILIRIQYLLNGTIYSASATSSYNVFYPWELDFNCCQNDLYIYQTINSGNFDIQLAANNITADNIIMDGAQAIYTAGNSIDLIPDFQAEYGSDVYLYIEGCESPSIIRGEEEIFQYRESNNSEEGFYSKGFNQEFEIVPNPNKGIFKVLLNDISSGTLFITDSYGRRVTTKEFKEIKDIDVNIQSQQSGVYIITIETENGISSEKFIKE